MTARRVPDLGEQEVVLVQAAAYRVLERTELAA